MFDEALSVVVATHLQAPSRPGCYRMLDGEGRALYVGKARDLKKRLQAYTRPKRLPNRLQRMLAATRRLELLVTQTEAEALLTEASLIKALKPRYNILLRDDKSFPSILLRGDHAFPQIVKHRGKQRVKGSYFGPFVSSAAVNSSIVELQKIFLLRSCSDSIFAHRSRPCLQYHIKRCSAPCVGYTDAKSYAQLVSGAKAFLKGKSEGVRARLERQMTEASRAQEYERAASLRDRLTALAVIQARTRYVLPHGEEADVLALWLHEGESCIEMFCFRNRRHCGNRAFFPHHPSEVSAAEIVASFIAQFYASHPPPSVIYAAPAPHEAAWLQRSLSHRYERRVRILSPRDERFALFATVRTNAEEALRRRQAEKRRFADHWTALEELLELKVPLQRVEIYDNSHLGATNPYAAMVVADRQGFVKGAYRKFVIRSQGAGGDDYAMMREVLSRRFLHKQSWGLPSLVVLDGGRGHITAAQEVLADYPLLPLLAIAKGEGRKAGGERVYAAFSHREAGKTRILSLGLAAGKIADKAADKVAGKVAGDSFGLFYFLLRLRDEAHRFASGAHRVGRVRAQRASKLDGVPSVGVVRRGLLLRHFGSARAVAEASEAELQGVAGLGEGAARKIYEHFHG